ncbi:unnamed protein product [Symbiodinium sp. KB8]|nr:unnamed protein product [Symbiodinium sp. KB8]
MKRPASNATAVFDGSVYSKFVKSYASREDAFQELGVGLRCLSHCGRAVKKDGKLTYLRCRLRPDGTWAALLRQESGGAVELWEHPSMWNKHTEGLESKGKRGFASLEERQALTAALGSSATSKPGAALRATRLDKQKPVKKTQLKQVQRLRKALSGLWFRSRTVGQFRELVAKASAVPKDAMKGYICHSKIERTGKKYRATVIATTPFLQRRFVNAKECPVAIDGGFKFNLLGWPLHVFGSINPAGEFGIAALALTSTMEHGHVAEMLKGFRDTTVKITGKCANKLFAMSDAEVAHRRALTDVYGAGNVMCFFHLKQAVRDNLYKRMSGTKKEKDAVWKWMSEDIDVVRAARNKLDFASRGAALKAEWLQKGLDKKACWTDKLDRSYDLVSNFCTQWLEAIPEWFVGATGGAGVPGTNNAAEATIKQTRVDAGQVACSVGELLHFILDQVQTASRSEWVSTADRPISARLWLKAAKFQTLFDTDQVRCYEKYSLRLFVSCPRDADAADDVSKRAPLPLKRAESLAAAFLAQVDGNPTTMEQLRRFNGPDGHRIFGRSGFRLLLFVLLQVSVSSLGLVHGSWFTV